MPTPTNPAQTIMTVRFVENNLIGGLSGIYPIFLRVIYLVFFNWSSRVGHDKSVFNPWLKSFRKLLFKRA